ncbi:hypothetical protein JXL19_00510 [bacterium]|nr:hypothetical protein [bacterium]
MRIAIPVYRFRVSPVFDFSTMAMVIEIENSKENGREEIDLSALDLQDRVERLKKANTDILICAGISLPLHRMLTLSGIKVFPGIVGQIDEVTHAYLSGRLKEKQFMMPGCCRRRKRRGGHCGNLRQR